MSGIAYLIQSVAPVATKNSIHAIANYMTQKSLIDAEFQLRIAEIESTYADKKNTRENILTDRKHAAFLIMAAMEAAKALEDKEALRAIIPQLGEFIQNTPDYLNAETNVTSNNTKAITVTNN